MFRLMKAKTRGTKHKSMLSNRIKEKRKKEIVVKKYKKKKKEKKKKMKKKEIKHMGLLGLISLHKEEHIESSSYTRGVRI